jgi:hypothetical protein
MTSAERRAQDLRRQGDRITDERAVRDWIAQMKVPERVRVERVSRTTEAGR